MSVKTNLLIAAVAVLGLSSAYAGGPEMMASPAALPFSSYFYSELGLGYADTGYNDFYSSYMDGSQGGESLTGTKNDNGGLAVVGDIGYVLMPHFAIELGGGYLPEYKANYEPGSGSTDSESWKVASWYTYGAARVDIDVLNKVNAYTKAGLAYRSMTITKDGDDLDDYYWAPFFGAGASYDVRDNLYVALEYNYVGSSNDTNEGLTAPAASLYLAKVGYKFNV